MIKIYFGNRIIHLTDENEPFYAHFKDRNQLRKLIEKFENGNHPELFIHSDDLNSLFLNFKLLFKYEEAAGGLKLNSLHQILVIKNYGYWQLPKGHVEENETFAETAIREVTEECNIEAPTIIEQLPATFHTFKKHGKWHLKKTVWFKMMYKGLKKPMPLEKEGITEAKWIDKKNMHEIYTNTYKNLTSIWAHI